MERSGSKNYPSNIWETYNISSAVLLYDPIFDYFSIYFWLYHPGDPDHSGKCLSLCCMNVSICETTSKSNVINFCNSSECNVEIYFISIEETTLLTQSGRGHQDDRAKNRSKNSQRLEHKIGPRRVYLCFPHETRVVFRAGSFYDSPEA